MLHIADAASRRLLVEGGDADIARDLGPDQIAALRGKPDLQVFECPSAAVHYLLFNSSNAANPVLKNPALWEAARWLIDYDGIAGKLLKGQYMVHQAFLAHGFPGALDTTPYHLDVAKAKAILAKAAIAPGTTIKLDVFNQPPFNEIAQSLQATFAQGGDPLADSSRGGQRGLRQNPRADRGSGVALLDPGLLRCPFDGKRLRLEPLDMSVQAEILNLLNRLKVSYKMTYLLVSHDRNVIAHMCDRAAGMHAGRIERLIGRDELSQINPNDIHRNLS
jgi:hypothetical protein